MACSIGLLNDIVGIALFCTSAILSILSELPHNNILAYEPVGLIMKHLPQDCEEQVESLGSVFLLVSSVLKYVLKRKLEYLGVIPVKKLKKTWFKNIFT